ncbi:DUF2239 family protein [Bosea sp. BIWAKO-01]|uniref:DUF2239 family protein n=1 Tax=Bosea sp. BIWAKO-01 TaxID=506668 RepID=UPI000852B7C1|nr:DUF2239 family protein [Bosea sp. BIWAKO-01]GAU86430.1 hypothetical protein BIWAKO_06378 [Bosea sp. BIWAKO-01]
MPPFLSKPCTAFQGTRRIAAGPLIDVALVVKAAMETDPGSACLTFDDATGAVVDLNLRGETAEIVARLVERAEAADRAKPTLAGSEPDDGMPERGRGRPKLGVVAREVTLLPRHWDWLALQPGGASQALRRLVEEARRGDGGRTEARAAQTATYTFIAAMAGDLAGFEEATRALFAGDHARFAEQNQAWPPDIRTYAETLLKRPHMRGPGEP